MHYTFKYAADGKVAAYGVQPPAADTEVGDTMTDTQIQTRTFHSSDYRRAASMLQRARAVKGNRYQGKDQAHQAKIDTVAAYLASVFADDATLAGEADMFSNQLFLAGTQLPQAPVFDPQAPGNEPWSGGEDNGAFGEDGEVV